MENNNEQPQPSEESPRLSIAHSAFLDTFAHVRDVLTSAVRGGAKDEPVITFLDLVKNVFKVAILCFFSINIVIGALAALGYMLKAGFFLIRFHLWDAVECLFATCLATCMTAAFLMLDMWFRKSNPPDWTVFKKKGKSNE